MSTAEKPELGATYALQLGDSLLGRKNHDTYASLRYDFKPASLGGSGVYRLQPGNKVSLHLPSCNAQFTGKMEPCKGDLDCVAVFDGTSWRLELLSANIITKYNRVAGGSSASLAATPELLSANTSCPSSDQPGGLGNDLFGSDEEVEGAGPRASSQPPVVAHKPQPKPSSLGQAKRSPGAAQSLGKRPASSPAQQAKPGNGKISKVEEGTGKSRSRLQSAGSAEVRPAPAETEQLEELDWDAAFEEEFADGEPELQPEQQRQQQLLQQQQQEQEQRQRQHQQAQQQAQEQRQRQQQQAQQQAQQQQQQAQQQQQQQQRHDAVLPKPATQPVRQPAPAAIVSQTAPAMPKALQPAQSQRPAANKPVAAAAPQPKQAKPVIRKPAKAAATDEWGFEGMDDEDEEEEEQQEQPETQQQASFEEEEQDDEDEEEEEEEPAPRVQAVQPSHAAHAQPTSYPTHHHMGDEDDDEDDDAHLRCSDDEASDGLGLEDGLC